MGSLCLFMRQRALKLGYFYWLRVKNSTPLLTELSLCYLKHTKFYLENKASFIQTSSIASFNSFFIALLWGYCTFSDSSVVSLKSSPWPKYTKYETIFPQKIMFYYQTFFSSSNMFFIRQFLANTWEKKSGVAVLVSSQLLWKVDMVLRWLSRWIICAAGLGRDTKRYRVRSMHSRSSLFSVVFMCLISPTQKFRLQKSTLNTKEWDKSRFDEILELWIFIWTVL